MRVLAETPGKVLRHGGVDVLDARSGAVSRPTVITSYSYCSHLHQMSIHLSCTETIIVICFRSVNKRQQLWRHPRLMMQRTPAIRTFKKCREFFCGENTRFVYHWIRLGKLQYVHTQPLPRLRAFLSCIIVKGSCTNAGTGPGCYWFRSFAEEFSASKKKTYLTVSLNPIQE